AVRCGLTAKRPISPKKSPAFKYATTISRSSSSRRMIDTDPFIIKYKDVDSDPASMIVVRFGKRLIYARFNSAFTDSGNCPGESASVLNCEKFEVMLTVPIMDNL